MNFRKIQAGALLTVFLFALPGFCVWAAEPEENPKVVIIGFDGADAELVELWMDSGDLPNLARLRDQGSYAPLQPTNPPQTPVSWSTFATGLNPGKTEIFDFLKRDPDNYKPSFALIEETRRTLMFGANNGKVLGAVTGVLAAFLLFFLLILARLKWKPRLVVAVIAGVALAIPVSSKLGDALPQEVPNAINNRQGTTFWELASEAGLDTTIIRVPATFPAEPMDHGEMLSGLGVPDMRGRVGTPSFYTSDPMFRINNNEFSLELVKLPARRGTIKTRLIGPDNKPFYHYVVDRSVEGISSTQERVDTKREVRQALDDVEVPRRIDLAMELTASDTDLSIALSGQTRTLRVGDWSEWFEVSFPVNSVVDMVQPLTGMVRFKLLALEPEIELYASPLSFHPDCHPVAFAWPPEYSEQIADRFGIYKTLGWALDTWSSPSGIGGDDLFLEDMEFTVAKYEEIMTGLLEDDDNDLYVQIFYFTDRIGHLFWRHLDSGHPLHDPEEAALMAPEMLKAYRKMDDLVGKAWEAAGDEAIFMVLSDHGFSSFRRGVNYNTWLVKNGLMKLKGQTDDPASLERLFDKGDLFTNVDWAETKAYALGLGSIYVNLIGREREGSVLAGPEYNAVRQQIKDGLEALVDPETGLRPITKVWFREEMYEGFDAALIPDLRVGNARDYRVSWQTTLGGVPPDILEDNTRTWSGDHCSNDPDMVRGIFFLNRKINTDSPGMLDVMPTILELLNLEPRESLDGKSLL
jgi:predicted AlkP superfamily phosphohydrolase/phosphomutase